MHTSWPRPFRGIRDMRIFLLSLSFVVAVVLAVVFLLRERAVNSLLVETVRQEAESYANLIVVTRHWNSQYGGVYVEKRPGVESNAYLRQLGIEPDGRTQDGRVLTLRNPAIMTREISDLAFSNNIVKFHLVSLKALNPENRPDAFEQDALERLTRGERDIWQIDRGSQPPLFRYMLPLMVERPCLRCHAQQGYAVGDAVFTPTPHTESLVMSTTETGPFFGSLVPMVKLPARLQPELGVFTALAGVAYNAILDGQPLLGESVAVFGVGVIGLLTIQR